MSFHFNTKEEFFKRLQRIHELKQETNFDISNSLKSIKNDIAKSAIENVQNARTILKVVSFFQMGLVKRIHDKFSADLSSICVSNPSTRFCGQQMFLREILKIIYAKPNDFAEIVFRKILTTKLNSNFAWNVFPFIYAHFTEITCIKYASEFLVSLLSYKTDNLSLYVPYLSAYITGNFGFHDLLWNTYLHKIKMNPLVEWKVLFRESVEIAATYTFEPYVQVLLSFNRKSYEFCNKFILESIFLPSLMMFQDLFQGMPVLDEMIDYFSGETKDDYYSLKLSNTLLITNHPNTKVPDYLSVFFQNGVQLLAPTMHLHMLLSTIIDEPAFQNNAVNSSLKKELVKMEKDSEILIPITYYFTFKDVLCEEHTSKPTNKAYEHVLVQLKQRCETLSVDLFSLFPLLDDAAEETSPLIGSEEFTTYALDREIDILEADKQQFDYVIYLTLLNNKMTQYYHVIKAMQEKCYQYVVSPLLFKPTMLSNAKINSSIDKAIQKYQKFHLPFQIFHLPTFIYYLDKSFNPKITKDVKKLCSMFPTINWTWESRYQLYSPAIHIISEEIEFLQNMLNDFHNMFYGNRFKTLLHITHTISIATDLLVQNNIAIMPAAILAQLITSKNVNDFIESIVYLKKLHVYIIQQTNIEKNFCLQQFQMFDLLISWVMNLFQENVEFVALLMKTLSDPYKY